MDLDAADLLAAVDAALKAAWRRTTGSTVDHHSARLRSILTGEAPGAAQSVEQAAPEAKPGPAREQSVKRAEGDVAQLSDCPPLHPAKADTPERHDRLAQRRSGQRRLSELWAASAGVSGEVSRRLYKCRSHL